MTHNMPYVYLAGPISGLSFEEGSGWREYCEANLKNTFNPLLPSDKDHLTDGNKFSNGKDLDNLISDMFFSRDLYWTEKCDIIIANFTIRPPVLGSGTIYELGYAHALRKLIILVGPDENIPLFATKGANVHFQTIEEAVEYIKTFGVK